MKLIQAVVGAVLTVALFVGGFAAGRKSVHHALVFDLATKKWAPLQLKTDTKIAVASPLGLEPGVAFDISPMKDEGMVAIILAPSMVPDDDKPAEPSKPQNQSDRERVDHADSTFRASN